MISIVILVLTCNLDEQGMLLVVGQLPPVPSVLHEELCLLDIDAGDALAEDLHVGVGQFSHYILLLFLQEH